MLQRQLAEIIVFFMTIVVSCPSHIVGFVAVDEYNLDFTIKMKFMEEG